MSTADRETADSAGHSLSPGQGGTDMEISTPSGSSTGRGSATGPAAQPSGAAGVGPGGALQTNGEAAGRESRALSRGQSQVSSGRPAPQLAAQLGQQGPLPRSREGLGIGSQTEELKLLQVVHALLDAETRAPAMLHLARIKDPATTQVLAVLLWYSYGTMTALLQEITKIYAKLSPPALTPSEATTACTAINLICVMSQHKQIKYKLLSANIPVYLFPFLNLTSNAQHFDHLRWASLWCVSALMTDADGEIVKWFMKTELVTLLYRLLEVGNDVSRSLAATIVQRIAEDRVGLRYLTATPERFYGLATVLSSVLASMPLPPPVDESLEIKRTLVRHLVKIYSRLMSAAPHSREGLAAAFPERLRNLQFIECYAPEFKEALSQPRAEFSVSSAVPQSDPSKQTADAFGLHQGGGGTNGGGSRSPVGHPQRVNNTGIGTGFSLSDQCKHPSAENGTESGAAAGEGN